MQPTEEADVTSDPDCLFCKIVAGEVPGEVVADNERALAFRDVNPQAPTHVLVVPRDHHPTVGALAAADAEALADVLRLATRVADDEKLDSHRLVFNTGAEAGQSVFHCHAHVLGGRAMTWPPG